MASVTPIKKQTTKPARRTPKAARTRPMASLITTTIKKAGGSLLVTVPAQARDLLSLEEGQTLEVGVEDGALMYRLVKMPSQRPRYALDELLAQCDPRAPLGDETLAWLRTEPVGKEEW